MFFKIISRKFLLNKPCCISYREASSLQQTALHHFHVDNGAKMVPFAGYSMPVSYGKVSLTSSHKHVRSACGIFDVSHMLQSKLHGDKRHQFLERLTVADVSGLKPDTGCLTLFTNERGGIIDDLIVTNTSKDHLYVVSNAGCRDKDLKHLKEQLKLFNEEGNKVELEIMDHDSLIALQGPTAATVLQEACSVDLSQMLFMQSSLAEVCGVSNCRITRCGYTGEDGFEISMPNDMAVEVTKALLNSKVSSVELSGLGARDSLRLEAGLCLYGNDITEDTTPVEATLAWTVAKRRRSEGGFLGDKVILNQLKNKPAVKRVGIISTGGPPLRPPSEVLGKEGEMVGKICSGCPSPSIGISIAMAYVPAPLAKVGTELGIRVRNKTVPATVTKMPFVKSNYFTKK